MRKTKITINKLSDFDNKALKEININLLKLKKYPMSDAVESSIRHLRNKRRSISDEYNISVLMNTKFGDISKNKLAKVSNYKEKSEIIKKLLEQIKDEVRNRRHIIKTSINKEFKKIGNFDINFVGGMIENIEGCDNISKYIKILEKTYERLLCENNKDIKNNSVGVEIECLTYDREKIKRNLVKKYRKLCPKCIVKEDGSLHTNKSEYENVEVCLVDTEQDIFKTVANVCEVLNKDAAAIVNRTCGLHVHIDCRGWTKDQLDAYWSKLLAAQEILYAVNPPSRGGVTGTGRRGSGSYCQKIDLQYAKDNGYLDCFPTARYAENLGRYIGINCKSYYTYIKENDSTQRNTIELRMHSGTTNPVKINNWIKLLLAIRDGEKITPEDNMLSYLKKIKLSDDVIYYFIERAKKFGHLNPEVEILVSEDIKKDIDSHCWIDKNYERYENDSDYDGQGEDYSDEYRHEEDDDWEYDRHCECERCEDYRRERDEREDD